MLQGDRFWPNFRRCLDYEFAKKFTERSTKRKKKIEDNDGVGNFILYCCNFDFSIGFSFRDKSTRVWSKHNLGIQQKND